MSLMASLSTASRYGMADRDWLLSTSPWLDNTCKRGGEGTREKGARKRLNAEQI
jgi:hypothetical protein